uniref:Uncharacterized protein n=1 Tax=Arundo donax TaxID=35708 RepID=A0A0A9ERU7_ARUDO
MPSLAQIDGDDSVACDNTERCQHRNYYLHAVCHPIIFVPSNASV